MWQRNSRLSKRHDIQRQLIRVWVSKYEARIAALERLVGKQALELEFLKGALKSVPPPRSGITSAITGPAASLSRKDAG